MTGNDLAKAIMRKIGVLAIGEEPAAADVTDILAEVNRMISSWANEKLMIYTETEDSLSLVAGTATYTWGSGGDLSTTKPVWIDNAWVRQTNTDYPLKIISSTEYARTTEKTLQTSIPCELYVTYGHPTHTLRLYPVPSVVATLYLLSKKPLSAITQAGTITLPPGYEDALVYNGAARLYSDFGKQLDPVVVQRAEYLKADLKRANHRPSYLSVDAAVVQNASFDINSGEYRR